MEKSLLYVGGAFAAVAVGYVLLNRTAGAAVAIPTRVVTAPRPVRMAAPAAQAPQQQNGAAQTVATVAAVLPAALTAINSLASSFGDAFGGGDD